MPGASPPFQRLLKGYKVAKDTGCWEWQGQLSRVGYGMIKVFGKMTTVHRYSYELHKGPITGGLWVLHDCDNKKCMNPSHLHLGTHADNMREAAERGLMPKGDDHPMRKNGSKYKGARLPTARPVIVKGLPFGSLNEAEKYFGLGSGSVAYWIKTNNPKARELTREEYFKLCPEV